MGLCTVQITFCRAHNESDAHNNLNCYEININKQEGHELSRETTG